MKKIVFIFLSALIIFTLITGITLRAEYLNISGISAQTNINVIDLNNINSLADIGTGAPS